LLLKKWVFKGLQQTAGRNYTSFLLG